MRTAKVDIETDIPAGVSEIIEEAARRPDAVVLASDSAGIRAAKRDGKLALIHNGIIENYAALKAELQAEGVEFSSQTDTEVAAHLLGREVARLGDLAEAMRSFDQHAHDVEYLDLHRPWFGSGR